MKLNLAAFTLTAGLFWAGALLVVALANLAAPSYGAAVLQLAASVYPGYQPGTGVGSVIVGSLYALVDGAIAGAIFGWVYNLMTRAFSAPAR